jgi:hypothetical protein
VAKNKTEFSSAELATMKEAMDAAELDFANAKLAYYHRTEYKGFAVNYESLRNYAEQFIDKNYAYQKAIFGKLRIKLSVPRLMRE